MLHLQHLTCQLCPVYRTPDSESEGAALFKCATSFFSCWISWVKPMASSVLVRCAGVWSTASLAGATMNETERARQACCKTKQIKMSHVTATRLMFRNGAGQRSLGACDVRVVCVTPYERIGHDLPPSAVDLPALPGLPHSRLQVRGRSTLQVLHFLLQLLDLLGQTHGLQRLGEMCRRLVDGQPCWRNDERG